jgi:hypothetical protein
MASALVLALLEAGSALAATPEVEGIRAFVAERFDEAAVGLKELCASALCGGSMGFEAVRGMLLNGAGAESASKMEITPTRPVDAAALLTVRAVAAEEKGDYDQARMIRTQLRELVKTRLATLERLESDPATEDALEGDLAAFWQRLRRAACQGRERRGADARPHPARDHSPRHQGLGRGRDAPQVSASA